MRILDEHVHNLDVKEQALIFLQTESVLPPGERSAFGEFYMRHRDAVFRAAYRRLGDAARAEDVTQDVFVRAAGVFGVLRDADEARQRSYLLVCARNRAVSELRSDRTAPLPETAQSRDDFGELERSAVLDLIRQMPDGQGDLILLCCVYGYTAEEVGAKLGLRPDAVRKRLQRAKERLRALLIENGYEEFFK